MGKQRVTVLGAGSIGLGLAGNLAEAGMDVTVLVRKQAIDLFRREGLKVTGVSGDRLIEPTRLAVDDLDEPAPASLDCDVLLVATKAYQVAGALKSIAGRAAKGREPHSILLMQNGWGSADEARDIMRSGTGIFSSIMMIGFNRQAANHVHNTGVAGPIRIGTLFGSASDGMKSFVEAAQRGFLPVVYEDSIEPSILNKFLFNSCVNAIGALTGRTYGDLVTRDDSHRLIVRLAEEGVRVVSAARGYEAARDGAQFVESVVKPVIIPRAASHRSSMLQDVEAGRRTEIDYLNGAICRLGQSVGAETPFNEAITSLIRLRTQT